jgi:phosphate transport system substrate-binding protein
MNRSENPVRRLARRRATALLGTALMFMAAFGSCAVHAEDPLKVQGSTTFNARLLEPFQREIEEMAGVNLIVIGSKSLWGVLALLEGRADVAMISADLAGEIAAARQVAAELAYDRLINFSISRTRVAFAVHPTNTIRALKLDDVRKILLGEITSWHAVGGRQLPIRVVAVQDGGGVVVAVRSQLLDGRPLVSANSIRLESPRHVIKVVQQEPAALGINQLGLIQAAGLPEITTESAVEQQLNLVTLGPPSARIKALIEAARAVAAERLM